MEAHLKFHIQQEDLPELMILGAETREIEGKHGQNTSELSHW